MPTTITSDCHSLGPQAAEIQRRDDDDLAQRVHVRPDRAVAISMRISRTAGGAALAKASIKALAAAPAKTLADMVGMGTPQLGGMIACM